MIYGIGTDIVNINRIVKLYNQYGKVFLDKILSKKEQETFIKKSDKEKTPYLAKRFAAKEAFAKALGTGIGKNISFSEISILNNEKGKPIISLEKNLNQSFSYQVSLSDEKEYAIAFVIIYKKK